MAKREAHDSNFGQNSEENTTYGEESPDQIANQEGTDYATAKEDLRRAKAEFNKNRKIIIQNIPPVTYEEVKNFIGSEVYNITISKKSRHAIASLLDGEKAEEIVQRLDGSELLGVSVSVELYFNENLLCVTHLPLNFTDEDFKSLATPHGAVERCFLLRSEKTGLSKGYGFVEFSHNKEKLAEAKSLIDGRRFGSCVLHCDFIDKSLVTFESLHSRCLFVDHLPQDYSNIMELRNVFSRVVSPIYCQLGLKGGQPLGFGVVEYTSAADAEETQRLLRSQKLSDKVIRVSFCIPGLSAMEVYNKQMESIETGPGAVKPGLLPDPVMPSPLMAIPVMKNLFSKNPTLMDGFQSLLQQLQQQLIQQMHTSKPGLLGIAPNMPVNPLMNPNLQVAILAVLVASEMQSQLQNLNQGSMMANPQLQQLMMNLQNAENATSQQGSLGIAKPSLLGNPMIAQANFLMTNLVSHLQQQQPPPPGSSTVPIGSSESDKEHALPPLDMDSLKQLKSSLQGVLLGSDFRAGEKVEPPKLNISPGIMGDNAPAITSDTQMHHGRGLNQPQINSVLSSLSGNQGSFANPVLAGILETQIRQQLNMYTFPGALPASYGNKSQNNNSSEAKSSLLGNPPGGAARPILGGTQSSGDSEYNYGARSDDNRGSGKNDNSANGQGNWRMNNFESQLLMQGRRLQGKGLLGDGPSSEALMAENEQDKSAYSNQSVERGYDYYYNQDSSSYNYQQQYDQQQQQQQQQQQYYNTNNQGSGYSQSYDYSQGYDFSQYYNQNNGSYGNTSSSYGNSDNNTGSYGNSSGNYDFGSYNQPFTASANKQDYASSYNQHSSSGYYGNQSNQRSSSQGYGSNSYNTGNKTPEETPGFSQYNEYMQQYMSQHASHDFQEYQSTSAKNSRPMREQPAPPGTSGSSYQPEPPGTTEVYKSSNRSNALPLLKDSFIKPNALLPAPQMTPIGSKRRSTHLLPSPEASPENNYIGQHSQGIGGHYASSYPSLAKKMRF